MFVQTADQEIELLFGIAGSDMQAQIRSIKSGSNDIGFRNAEGVGDVRRNGWRSRGGQRQHLGNVQIDGQTGEFQIVRPEIVAPFADAMRLHRPPSARF